MLRLWASRAGTKSSLGVKRRLGARQGPLGWPVGLVLVGFGCLMYLRMRAFPIPLVDDAFIFMRYAEHIAAGAGFVWNRGGPPVEGFTAFSYQLLLAGLARLGLLQIPVVTWLGTGFGLLTLLLTWQLAWLINPNRPTLNLIALLLTALSPPFLIWTTAGMETPLYAALLLAGLLSYLAYRRGRLAARWVGFFFGLATLTRPEALALLAATLLFEYLRPVVHGERWRGRPIIEMAAVFLLLVGPYLVWRWRYFGYPLPNTYYAKTGGGLAQLWGGLDYLGDSLWEVAGGPALLLPLSGLGLRWYGRQVVERFYLALIVAVSWLVIVLSGGDHFGSGRFLMPTVPLMMILAAEGLSGWCERWRWTTRGATVVGAGLLGLALSQWLASSAYGGLLQGWHYVRAGQSAGVLSVEQTDEPYMPDSTAGYVIMGQSLHDLTSPEASIAVVPAGAIGYFSQRTVIDMVGLTDPVIAHQPFDPAYSHTWRPGHDKGDGAYILSQRPDYIQLFDVLSREPRPQPDAFALQYKSIAELWALAEFHHQYEFSPVQVTGGWYYNLYRRRELMPTPLDVPREQ